MTVPALDTSFIGTYAYLHPATRVQIADVLPYLHSYQQYPEYVDGVMRIYDTGGASGYYCDCYVRVRTDGWMMAFFPDDAHQGTACWGSYAWVLGDYNNRGDLIWWGHAHTTTGDPTADSTRLGRALSEMWTQLKANSDTPGYTFDYADVGYYDYELTTSTKIYIFGAGVAVSTAGAVQQKFYFTLPIGTTPQGVYANYGYYLFFSNPTGYYKMNTGTANAHILFAKTAPANSNGYIPEDVKSYTYTGGTQNELHLYVYNIHVYQGGRINGAIVIFADS